MREKDFLDIPRERSTAERDVVTQINYENGERLSCKYSIRESLMRGKTVREMLSFTVSTQHGEIDIFERLGISGVVPVKIVPIGESEYASFFDQDGELVSRELLIPEPNNPESLAIFFHEAGHFSQEDDSGFLPGSRIGHLDYMNLIAAGQAAEKSFENFSYAWFDVRKCLPKIPRGAIRKRFVKRFDDFLLQLPIINTFFDRYYELECERSELEAHRMNGDHYGHLLADQEAEREKDLLRMISIIISNIPMQEILFFITEPIRYYERDATLRAVSELKKLGDELQVTTLSRLNDVGTKQLFLSLDTYSHGCVKGVIVEKGSEGASV